jgi:hypothetical protein
MAKLYGKVSGDDRAGVTQQANDQIEAWVQTEKGRVSISLRADGSYHVWRNAITSRTVAGLDKSIACGNINPD